MAVNLGDLGVLGKEVIYKDVYDANLLFAIERNINRKKLNLNNKLPFCGYDIWRCYEISWLGPKGKPEVAILNLSIPADSKYLVESKSLKLYLNSFNASVFDSVNKIKDVIKQDLERKLNCEIKVDIDLISDKNILDKKFNSLSGKCLDDLDIDINNYKLDKNILDVNKNKIANNISESLYTHLFKSNCPITNQPDWASVWISYSGEYQINHEKLLKYLISFRNNQEFHEHCVERIFMDIIEICNVDKLTVAAFYTRRGGIDINPLRSNDKDNILDLEMNLRLIRQ
tara:strand:+ start:126 stop:983 length:858 start_codon:yes stop_codon:yes gene_type:complete